MPTVRDNVLAARSLIREIGCTDREAGEVAAYVLYDLERDGLLPRPASDYTPYREPFG